MAMASLLSSLLRRSSRFPRLAPLCRLAPSTSQPHLFSTSASSPTHALNPNPAQVWLDLSVSASSASDRPRLPKSQWDSLTALFRSFSRSPWATDQALSLYLPSSAFSSAVAKFRLFFLSNCSPHTAHHLLQMADSHSLSAVHQFLFPIFAEFCLKELQDDLTKYQKLMETADLTKPHTWYPFARAMKRKIIYHCGPTNSGKTYNALCRFAEAKTAVYCSPLRLLAMEVFDKVNSLGVYCSLRTGQEIKDVPFSNHVACTIEMLSTDELYEVAVIDEVYAVLLSFFLIIYFYLHCNCLYLPR
jgi:ATP-dependent RNA helicase SUPV3L1/SUV3